MTFIHVGEISFTGNFQNMVERFGAVAFDRQHDLLELIRGEPWRYDGDAGVLAFGKKFLAQVQLIGSFSTLDNSWMWSWANIASQFPERLLIHSRAMKKIGEQNGVEELIQPDFGIEEAKAHTIAMIASGMFRASAYYPADYGQGYSFMNIESSVLDDFTATNPPMILTRFPQFITSFEVNHRTALKYYLQARNFAVQEEGRKTVGTLEKNEVFAEFDEQGRLASLNGKIAAPPKKKKRWFFW